MFSLYRLSSVSLYAVFTSYQDGPHPSYSLVTIDGEDMSRIHCCTHVLPQTLQWCGIAMHLPRLFCRFENITRSLLDGTSLLVCVVFRVLNKNFICLIFTWHHIIDHFRKKKYIYIYCIFLYRANPADSENPMFPINTLYLGGGFKHFLFSPLFGKIPILTYIFQMVETTN